MEYISLFNIDLFKIEGKTTWQNTLSKAMAEVIPVYPDSSPWFSPQLTGLDIQTKTVSPELKTNQLGVPKECHFLLACEPQDWLVVSYLQR